MHWSELPASDQIFTHFDETTGEEHTFAASALRRFCAREGSELCGVDATHVAPESDAAEMLRTQRGLEPARFLRALSTERYFPLLFVLMPDESALLVDGSHSYLAQYMRGLRDARAYLVPWCLAKNFLVQGLPRTTPEELLASWSGVI